MRAFELDDDGEPTPSTIGVALWAVFWLWFLVSLPLNFAWAAATITTLIGG